MGRRGGGRSGSSSSKRNQQTASEKKAYEEGKKTGLSKGRKQGAVVGGTAGYLGGTSVANRGLRSESESEESQMVNNDSFFDRLTTVEWVILIALVIFIIKWITTTKQFKKLTKKK